MANEPERHGRWAVLWAGLMALFGTVGGVYWQTVVETSPARTKLPWWPVLVFAALTLIAFYLLIAALVPCWPYNRRPWLFKLGQLARRAWSWLWPKETTDEVPQESPYGFEHSFDADSDSLILRFLGPGFLGLVCEVKDPRSDEWVRMSLGTGDKPADEISEVRYPEAFADAPDDLAIGRYGVRWILRKFDPNSADWDKPVGEVVLAGSPYWFDHDGLSFSAEKQIEPMGDDYTERIDGENRTYKDITKLWAIVHNNARAGADFSACVRNAQGLKPVGRTNRIPRTGYEVHEVAWEHTADRRYQIGSDGNARLMLITVAQRPKRWRLWFWTAKSAQWGHGKDVQLKGWRLRPISNEFTFDLHITNETTNETALYKGVVRTNEDGRVEDFTLDPCVN